MGLRKEVKETSNTLELTYQWYEPYQNTGLIFFVVWDFISISLYYPELTLLFKGEFTFPKNLFAFFLFFMMVPVPTYWMLVYMINKTCVELSASEVIVRNGPLPWWRKNQTFSWKEIRYICIEDIFPDSIENHSQHLKAIMKNGDFKYIFLNMQNPEESQIACSRISLWLKKMNRSQLSEKMT